VCGFVTSEVFTTCKLFCRRTACLSIRLYGVRIMKVIIITILPNKAFRPSLIYLSYGKNLEGDKPIRFIQREALWFYVTYSGSYPPGQFSLGH
jgi:hypothetical protein